MNKKIQISLLVCIVLATTTACKNRSNSIPQDDKKRYTYIELTPKLIDELGGVQALSQYQMFLSEGFTLNRTDNDKTAKSDGAIKNTDHNYTITFTKETPGVIKSCRETDRHSMIIEVYFDEEEDAFLTFESEMGGYNIYYNERNFNLCNSYGYGNLEGSSAI